MAVIREFLGTEQLLATPAPEPTSPDTTTTPSPDLDGPSQPVNNSADNAAVRDQGEGVTCP
jgi:hypothetical protein